MAKSSKEKFKTLKHVFDLFTERNLFKMISRGYFEGLESPIEMGKEANIFTAITKEGKRVIVKIYRLSTADFYKMYEYLQSDPRFPSLDKNKRQVIFSWARREYRNLLKAREAGARVPTPITQFFNILVMDFVGGDEPAPKLKDKKPENPKEFFDDVIANMRKLYKAGLVHADLSAFNILNQDEKPVFIDMSQATTRDNPNASQYLERDIRNITTFFKKLGLKIDEEQLMKKITGK
jgi:RIO kinase 1